EFHRTEVGYLGLIISRDGVKMDPKKVQAITAWEAPTNIHDVRAFLGFANFYRRFIDGYSRVVAPLVNLTRKAVKFEWDSTCEAAFTALKQQFTTAPILRHFDPDREVLVETDASDYVSAEILSQRDDCGTLHPVAFYSKKHSPAECNYEIYDKELLAIVRCFEEWRAELESTPFPIQVLTDHKNLEYFMTTKLLNRRQARWSEFLSRFDFKITYRPGKAGGKPDALTRRSGDLPREGDERLALQHQVVLKPKNLDPAILTLAATGTGMDGIDNPGPRASLEELFDEGYAKDPLPQAVIKQLQEGQSRSKQLSLAECEVCNGRLIYRERVYVPDYPPLKLRLIQDFHATPAAGHPGRSKTLELLSRQYHWPLMRKEVDRFVRNCHTCQRSRTSRHAPFGILRPLPIPDRPWSHLQMYFVVVLPWPNGADAILQVECRLTKRRHLIPCRATCSAEELADLFARHIFRIHGLPKSVISDRGPTFVSKFWKALCLRLKIEVQLSTPYHPQTDGQTERLNAVLEQYLRGFVNYLQDDWEDWLHLAEFAGNNQASETTGVSPFFANYGYDPTWQFELIAANPRVPEERDAQELAKRFKEITEHLQAEMLRAQHRHQEQADKRRKPAPAFKEGDLVWF